MPVETVSVREGEQEPARAVLFRQIQQWVAAGYQAPPADSEKPDGRADTSAETAEHSVIVFERTAPTPDRTRRSGVRGDAIAEPPAPVAEQRFELSIGTISVIVEGEDARRPPARAVAVPPDGQTRQRSSPRQYSRLSRHYL